MFFIIIKDGRTLRISAGIIPINVIHSCIKIIRRSNCFLAGNIRSNTVYVSYIANLVRRCWTIDMTMISGSELEIYLNGFWEDRFSGMYEHEVLNWRRGKLQEIDGDLLSPIHLWPTYIRRIFFKRRIPIGDSETFVTLILFWPDEYQH